MKFVTFAAASALLATPALAADAVVYNEPAPIVADTFSWTGGYIGVNAGYAGGKFKHPLTAQYREDSLSSEWQDEGSATAKVTSSGFIGGVQAGYNWQIERTVVGIETDFQGSGLKGEASLTFNDMGSMKAGTKVKWFGTTRARLGYLPTERLMVYATGGVAYGKVETYGSISEFGGDTIGFSNSKTRVGYTVGAGAEYAFTDNWTLKSEYLYTDLGKMKFTLGDETDRMNIMTKAPFHTIRVGLNYKF